MKPRWGYAPSSWRPRKGISLSTSVKKESSNRIETTRTPRRPVRWAAAISRQLTQDLLTFNGQEEKRKNPSKSPKERTKEYVARLGLTPLPPKTPEHIKAEESIKELQLQLGAANQRLRAKCAEVERKPYFIASLYEQINELTKEGEEERQRRIDLENRAKLSKLSNVMNGKNGSCEVR